MKLLCLEKKITFYLSLGFSTRGYKFIQSCQLYQVSLQNISTDICTDKHMYIINNIVLCVHVLLIYTLSRPTYPEPI